jgi:hypothetical protein
MKTGRCGRLLLLRILVPVAAVLGVVLMAAIDIIGEPHVFAGKAEQGETLPWTVRAVHGTQAIQRFCSVGFSIQHEPPFRNRSQ